MGRGGKRPGAGRPRDIQRLSKELDVVRRQLKDQISVGMSVLAEGYAGLINEALRLARSGSVDDIKRGMLIMRLIELPFRVMNLDEPTKTPFDGVREKWTYERVSNEDNESRENRVDIKDAEYRVIP